ncbi:hypothetical protein [Deinococcus multiflagellatus]|uniref:Alpha-galactosidase NEW3 domain-containing protein n=1 Tax=Deinococcus multiflagellatus TaxID=1656887 RepID=A0ABW1ZIC7_9DEIO
MKRAALLTCLWLGTLSGLGAQAAVRLSGEVSGETGRGALTLRLEVRHDSGPAEEVRPTVTLPPGWRLLLPPPAVTVAPGEVRAVTLTILPPPARPPAATRCACRPARPRPPFRWRWPPWPAPASSR